MAGLAALALCLTALVTSAQDLKTPQAAPAKATTATTKAADTMEMACCVSAESEGLVCQVCNPTAKAEVGKPAINFELADAKGVKHQLTEYLAKDKMAVLIWANQ